jgi:hypothetical protein
VSEQQILAMWKSEDPELVEQLKQAGSLKERLHQALESAIRSICGSIQAGLSPEEGREHALHAISLRGAHDLNDM